MIRRLLHSRGWRKLRKNRMALVALGIILVYLSLGLAVYVFGAISKEESLARVGPKQMVGFFEKPTVEQRLHDLQWYLEQIDGVFNTKRRDTNPEELLANIDYLGLRAADLSVDEFGERLDSIWEVYDELLEIQEDDAFADDPANLERLSQLEEDVHGLYRQPEGKDGRFYRLALSLGTDSSGRSIALRALYSIKVAIQIGLVTAIISVLLGTLLGGAAAFFGGWVDHLIVWLYSTFSAIPYIVLLMVLASMFLGSRFEGTLIPVYTAFCLTFWIGPCRVIRGEVMKLRELEYVQAATAVGYGRLRILLLHILPNTAHLMFINFSLLFIGAIKAEVILSFLNLGVKNEPSWGKMIQESGQEVLNGFFWQIGAATALMFVLVLAFNVLSDALQDAFDPKHV